MGSAVDLAVLDEVMDNRNMRSADTTNVMAYGEEGPVTLAPHIKEPYNVASGFTKDMDLAVEAAPVRGMDIA